jgi:uncharacterized protein (TIGR03435 family)
MMPISILLKATVILGLTLAAVRLARGTRASVRHVLLAAGFAALLMLPAISIVTPAVAIVVPTAVQEAIAPQDAEAIDAGAAAAGTTTLAPRPPAMSPVELPSLEAFLISAWIGGAVVFLLPVAIGLQQVRSIRRTALPWPEGRAIVDALAAGANGRRRVEVLLHEAVPGPMTCGVRRPAVFLPVDAPTWPADELRRAIIHELEHVRRADWLSQFVARVITACYWCHPVVWIVRRQLALEAERACDDGVLSSEASTPLDADADVSTDYARQLIGLARRLSTGSNAPLPAMANRSDLAMRVFAVLDSGRPRGRAGGVCVASAIAGTVILAAAISSIQIVTGAQTPAEPAAAGQKPKYDAATIKPCVAEEKPTGARGAAGGTNATFSPGRFFVPCVTTEQLIYLAYASYGAAVNERLLNDDFGTASNDKKIRGGPSWVHSVKDKYSVEATASGATERTVLMGTMLQSLLEDRFRLKLHRETEDVAMQTLTVAKSGFKLKPMQEDDCDPDGPTAAAITGTKPRCGTLYMMTVEGKTRWSFGTGTMSSLASQLSRALGVHVIDQTGITDKFVFVFEFARDSDPGSESPSVGTALEEQLGLKLTKIRGPRGFIVIDAIERPSTGGRP